MKVKDIKDLLSGLDNEGSISFYVFDYEYDKEEPYDVGSGTFVEFDNKTFVIGINR